MKIEHTADVVTFSDILTTLDTPSIRPPRGSLGHRLLIPSPVAHESLASLPGTLVVVEPQGRIGVGIGMIESAMVFDHAILITGVLNAQQFPNEVAFLERHSAELACAYSLSDVEVVDADAPVWELKKLRFDAVKIMPKKDIA